MKKKRKDKYSRHIHRYLAQSKHLCYGVDKRINTYLKTFFFVNTYILYKETPRPNTNRHVHAHKCLHCAGIEPAASRIVGEHSPTTTQNRPQKKPIFFCIPLNKRYIV
jgi:hypothetical protein